MSLCNKDKKKIIDSIKVFCCLKNYEFNINENSITIFLEEKSVIISSKDGNVVFYINYYNYLKHRPQRVVLMDLDLIMKVFNEIIVEEKTQDDA